MEEYNKRTLDIDKSIYKSAGGEMLNLFSPVFELQYAMKNFNCNLTDAMKLDDKYVTLSQVGESVRSFVDKRFIDLKQKQAKSKKR